MFRSRPSNRHLSIRRGLDAACGPCVVAVEGAMVEHPAYRWKLTDSPRWFSDEQLRIHTLAEELHVSVAHQRHP